MTNEKASKLGLIQHKVRPAVKAWIETQAKAQERSQAWFVHKIVEDAYARALLAEAEAPLRPS